MKKVMRKLINKNCLLYAMNMIALAVVLGPVSDATPILSRFCRSIAYQPKMPDCLKNHNK